MPSSAVRTFTDPDEYTAAIRGATAEVAITQRGDFQAKWARIDLHRLWMQRYSDNLSRILNVTNLTAGRTYISFRTRPGPSFLQGGMELSPFVVQWHGPGSDYYQRSSGSAHFGTMSLPVEDSASVGEAMAGLDLTPPHDPILITPPRPAIERLQRLHAAARDLAENAPEIITNPNAARGLERALIETLVHCLGTAQHGENSLAQGQHAVVMRRFRRAVEESCEQPLYIPELCKAIGVSERKLRMCSQEHLGVSPKRYLLLRRMHLSRRALREAAPDATSVTDIATSYGFWQLGRFAVEYQALFGEPPSATLRRRYG